MATSANVFFGNVAGVPTFKYRDMTGSSADVASAAQSRASLAGEDTIRVWCPVAMYVAFGTNPDASVTTTRIGVGAGASVELSQVPVGTKVAVLNA